MDELTDDGAGDSGIGNPGPPPDPTPDPTNATDTTDFADVGGTGTSTDLPDDSAPIGNAGPPPTPDTPPPTDDVTTDTPLPDDTPAPQRKQPQSDDTAPDQTAFADQGGTGIGLPGTPDPAPTPSDYTPGVDVPSDSLDYFGQAASDYYSNPSDETAAAYQQAAQTKDDAATADSGNMQQAANTAIGYALDDAKTQIGGQFGAASLASTWAQDDPNALPAEGSFTTPSGQTVSRTGDGDYSSWTIAGADNPSNVLYNDNGNWRAVSRDEATQLMQQGAAGDLFAPVADAPSIAGAAIQSTGTQPNWSRGLQAAGMIAGAALTAPADALFAGGAAGTGAAGASPVAFSLRSFVSNAVINGLPEHVPGTDIPIPEFMQHGLAMAADNPTGILDSIKKVGEGIMNPQSPAVASLADDIASAFTQDDTTFQRQAGLQKELVPSLIGAVTVQYHGGIDLTASIHNPVDVYQSHFEAAIQSGQPPEQAAIAAEQSIHSKVGELLWSLNPYNPAYGWVTSPLAEQTISSFFGRPMEAAKGVAGQITDAGEGITRQQFLAADQLMNARSGLLGLTKAGAADTVVQGLMGVLDKNGSLYTAEGFDGLYGLVSHIVGNQGVMDDATRQAAAALAARTGINADGLYSYAASIADGLTAKTGTEVAQAIVEQRLAHTFTGDVGQFAYRAGTSAVQVGDEAITRQQFAKSIEGDLRNYFYKQAGVDAPDSLAGWKATANAGVKVATDILRTLFLINAAPALALQKILDEALRASTESVFGIRPADTAIVRAASRFGAESKNPFLQNLGNYVGDRSAINRQIASGVRVPDQLLRDGRVNGLVQGITGKGILGDDLKLGARLDALNPLKATDRGLTKFLNSTIQSPTQHVLLNAANKEFIDRIGGYQNLKEETASAILATPGVNANDAAQYANGIRAAQSMSDFRAVMRDFARDYPAITTEAPTGQRFGVSGILDTGDVQAMRDRRAAIDGIGRPGPPEPVVHTNGNGPVDLREWQRWENNYNKAEAAGNQRGMDIARQNLDRFSPPPADDASPFAARGAAQQQLGRDFDPGAFDTGGSHLLPGTDQGAGLRPFEPQPLGDSTSIGTAGPPPVTDQTWYHGTGATNLTAGALTPESTSAFGLYGPGIYMTDNPEIAGSYGSNALRQGKAGAAEPTAYEARVRPGKTLDLDKPAPPEVRDLWARHTEQLQGGDDPEWLDLLDNPQASTRDLFDLARNLVRSGEMPVELNNFLAELNQDMVRDLGYDAYTHVGGNRVGNVEHNVHIALDPNGAYGSGASPYIQSFDRVSYGPEGTRVLGENPATSPARTARAQQYAADRLAAIQPDAGFSPDVGFSRPIGINGPPTVDTAGILGNIEQTGQRYTQGLSDIRQGGLERGYRIVGNNGDQTNLGAAMKQGVQLPQSIPGVGGLTILPAILPFAPFHIHTTQFWIRQFAESPYMPVAILGALKQAGIDDYGNYGLPGGGAVNGIERMTTAGHIMQYALNAQKYFEDLRAHPNGNNLLQQLLKNAAYDTIGNNAYVAPFGSYSGLGQSLVQGATHPLLSGKTDFATGKPLADSRDLPYQTGSEGWIEGGLNQLGGNRNLDAWLGGAGNGTSNLGKRVGMGIGSLLGGDTNIKAYNPDAQLPYFANNYAAAQGWDRPRIQAAVDNPTSPDGRTLLAAYAHMQDTTGLGKAFPLRFTEADAPGKPVYPSRSYTAENYQQRAGQGGRDAGTGLISKAGNYYVESPDQAAQTTARAQLKLGENPATPFSVPPEFYPTIGYARDYLGRVGDNFLPPGGRAESQAIADRSQAIYQGSLDGAARRTQNSDAFFYDRNAGQGGRDAGVNVPTKAGGTFLETPDAREQSTARAQLKEGVTPGTVPTMDYARDYLQQVGDNFLPNRPESQAIAERSQALFQSPIDANARRTGAGLPQDQRMAQIAKTEALQTPVGRNPDGTPFTLGNLLAQPGNVNSIEAQLKGMPAGPQKTALEAALANAKAKDSTQSSAAAAYFAQQDAAFKSSQTNKVTGNAKSDALNTSIDGNFTVGDFLRQPGNLFDLDKQYADAKARNAPKSELSAIGKQIDAIRASDLRLHPEAAAYFNTLGNSNAATTAANTYTRSTVQSAGTGRGSNSASAKGSSQRASSGTGGGGTYVDYKTEAKTTRDAYYALDKAGKAAAHQSGAVQRALAGTATATDFQTAQQVIARAAQAKGAGGVGNGALAGDGGNGVRSRFTATADTAAYMQNANRDAMGNVVSFGHDTAATRGTSYNGGLTPATDSGIGVAGAPNTSSKTGKTYSTPYVPYEQFVAQQRAKRGARV